MSDMNGFKRNKSHTHTSICHYQFIGIVWNINRNAWLVYDNGTINMLFTFLKQCELGI